jgi:hypothetical protein
MLLFATVLVAPPRRRRFGPLVRTMLPPLGEKVTRLVIGTGTMIGTGSPLPSRTGSPLPSTAKP